MSKRWIVLGIILLACLVPSQVLATTPPQVNWGAMIPGFHPGLDLSSANECTSGKAKCVEAVIREMTKTFQKLARDCDHNAIFQLGYMRTTEAYYESSQIPGFYSDVPWMHHYDAVFAGYYVQPQKDWGEGDVLAVPPAWREAFASADAEELTSSGNFLMGMNAHINRDLPFVISDIGTTTPTGASRKPDHEKVNEFLNQVGDDMGPEMIARFDPSWDTNPDDDVYSGLAIMQLIQEWRERAWNNAVLMNNTPPAVSALVAQGIEQGAAVLAQMIREAQVATPEETAARNAYCAEHWDDWTGDGTYFDGSGTTTTSTGGLGGTTSTLIETLPDIGFVQGPLPSLSLTQLAAMGVVVDVSIETGVTVSLG